MENQRDALVLFPAAAWVSSLKKLWPLILRSKSTRGAFYPDRVASTFARGRIEFGSWFTADKVPPPTILPSLRWTRETNCYLGNDLSYITSTKNSPALPTASRRDWRDAFSSGGTEASSLPGGAPGAAVDRCGGWGGSPGGP